MEYADQTSGSIRLYLTKGDLDLKQFVILDEKGLIWKDLSVSFGVLGESHFVRFTKKEKIFTEICACTDAVIPKNIQTFESNFLANLPNEGVRTMFDDFTYEFSFEFKSWEEGESELVKLRLLKNKELVTYLSHFFPKLESDIDEPVTEVYIVPDKDGIEIYSVHTYPNETMMVFTKSTLRV